MPQSAHLSAGRWVQWLFGQCPNELLYFYVGASLRWLIIIEVTTVMLWQVHSALLIVQLMVELLHCMVEELKSQLARNNSKKTRIRLEAAVRVSLRSSKYRWHRWADGTTPMVTSQAETDVNMAEQKPCQLCGWSCSAPPTSQVCQSFCIGSLLDQKRYR